MTITATQLKYARERAKAVYDCRTAKLREKHTTEAVKLTVVEKVAAIKAGRFTITGPSNPDHRYYQDLRLDNHIKFKAERSESFNQTKFDTDKSALDVVYGKLVDELVLGDNETALALLHKFEGK